MARSTRDSGFRGGASGDGGEFRSGPIAGTAMVGGVTFTQKGLQYAEVDGQAIFEGDIVLGSVDQLRAAEQAGPIAASVGLTGAQFRWPNGVIPYEIDSSLPNQQRVTDAIAHWEANTPIRFVLRSTGTFTDFVRFQPGGGCSSNVGRRGGQQTITLGDGCSTGNAIHEIGHTVGLWHEQSREDRDTWVRIVWANIDPATQHNFLQHIADGDDLGQYDYGSIMHYPPSAFSINGQDTIVPLQAPPPGVVMGQRDALSAGDIAGVRAMYPNIGPTIKEVGKDPIQDTVKELAKDPRQDTIKEIRKDPVQDTIKEVRKDPIQDTVKEPRKDPIQDTLKEVRKEPVQDTIKEVGGDPGTLVEQTQILPGTLPFTGQGAVPFVMATPSRAGYGGMADAGAIADAQAHLQDVAQMLGTVEQQYYDLAAMYEAALQQLDALQGQ